jgi:hypothetical protein
MRSGRRLAVPALLALASLVVAAACGGTEAPAPGPDAAPPAVLPPSTVEGESIVQADASWTCDAPVDLDLVKITMRSTSDHAIYLNAGCTGRIGRIEIDTWQKDGVKVTGAADLDIDGGYIRCHDRDDSVHQDGVQAQTGDRVTFRELTIDCPTSNNAAFFVSRSGDTIPTDIVCDHCTLLPANSTVNIKLSVRSGVSNSIVCRGETAGLRIQFGAIEAVDDGNLELDASDSRCQSES